MRDDTSIILPEERPKSWNTFWAGTHWTKRKKEADRVHLVVRSYIDPDTAKVYDVPVDILVIGFYDTSGRKKLLDSGNIVSKPYVDALIGWYIKDDSREFVRRVSTQSEVDNNNPRTVIIIEPVK